MVAWACAFAACGMSRYSPDEWCVCGHRRSEHPSDDGLCSKDEFCQCAGFYPQDEPETYLDDEERYGGPEERVDPQTGFADD